MSKKLVILGAGGYANTVKDVSEQLAYDVIAMLDDRFADRTLDSFTKYIADDTEFIPAFGNNEFRLSWCDKITRADVRLATVVHPTAYVSPTASIEKGVVVLPKAVINTDVTVKRGCIINLGAIVDHGCVIEQGCHICLGAIVKGENRIAVLSKIEAGEVVQLRQYPVNK